MPVPPTSQHGGEPDRWARALRLRVRPSNGEMHLGTESADRYRCGPTAGWARLVRRRPRRTTVPGPRQGWARLGRRRSRWTTAPDPRRGWARLGRRRPRQTTPPGPVQGCARLGLRLPAADDGSGPPAGVGSRRPVAATADDGSGLLAGWSFPEGHYCKSASCGSRAGKARQHSLAVNVAKALQPHSSSRKPNSVRAWPVAKIY